MDPLLLMVMGGLAFLAMCISLLAAIMIAVLRRRVPRMSLGLAALWLGVLAIAIAAMPPGYDAGEVERVKALQAEFAPALETYRREHGAYPATLEAVGIETPETKYGPLQYRAYVDQSGNAMYSLSMGDYFQNGFVAFWDSDDARTEWNLDM